MLFLVVYYVELCSLPIMRVPLLQMAIELTGFIIGFGAARYVTPVKLLALMMKFMSLKVYFGSKLLAALAAIMFSLDCPYELLLFYV